MCLQVGRKGFTLQIPVVTCLQVSRKGSTLQIPIVTSLQVGRKGSTLQIPTVMCLQVGRKGSMHVTKLHIYSQFNKSMKFPIRICVCFIQLVYPRYKKLHVVTSTICNCMFLYWQLLF